MKLLLRCATVLAVAVGGGSPTPVKAAATTDQAREALESAELAATLAERARRTDDPYLMVAALRILASAGLAEPDDPLFVQAKRLADGDPAAMQAIDAASVPITRAPFKRFTTLPPIIEYVRAGKLLSKPVELGAGEMNLGVVVSPGVGYLDVRDQLTIKVLDAQGNAVVSVPPAPANYMRWTSSKPGVYRVEVRNNASRDASVQLLILQELQPRLGASSH